MTFEFSDTTTGTCGIGSSCSALSCSKNGSADAPPPKPVVPANSVCDVITIWGQLTGRYVQIIEKKDLEEEIGFSYFVDVSQLQK